MVVCSCNVITDGEIMDALERLVAPGARVTPVLVYRTLGRAPRCGGCLPHAEAIVRRRTACCLGTCTQDDCGRCRRASRASEPAGRIALASE